ncbi:class I SAM-dependent methyltransferase [Enterovibrio sp. ZSDZ42]|uniref:Class I SAM-dependent methyltransferase n=1 Tax=Enterovibrio gelatinilyticus TaxID=2899819 RepID=A0ABT5QYZ3_9GAMM|nr:class I SAM-dependent methyltransferase [Enterovibrio sp. ZSDZ42]MDD1792761.1 class I SAM-dependent methyltransferase [Enterovibrio sp. ZSDZ42]
MNRTIQHYHTHAQTLDAQYQQVTFEQVHDSWRLYWPEGNDRTCKVLDVGAGNGGDAAWFAKRGCDVYAVEPADAFRAIGEARTQSLPVTWLSDTLPELKVVNQLSLRFDCILLSAVWMHIAPSDRARAFRKLANVLAPNGRLVITLRHGSFDDARTAHAVSVEEIEQYAKDHALQVRLKTDVQADSLGRDCVKWQTVVLTLPDDGSGDLLTVRHVIVNDSKAATYKLALLRTLLRIADAHPGALVDRTDKHVAIPLGLVALYWMRQYKRLLDTDAGNGMGIQQNSDPNKGLSFVKDAGWGKLKGLAADDLAIGAFFSGEEALALQKAIRDTITTLKSGPVKFTYRSDITKPLFAMERNKTQTRSSFVIDSEFLSSFGIFTLEESLWDCLRLYASWIEPLVVNQWIAEMRRYELNQQRAISLQTYHDCLAWIDASHDTRNVRKRIESLRENQHQIVSVWSNTKLNDKYHVDHCLPFAYWPNNDMWNLFPTTEKENLTKLNRVPSKQRLESAKTRILDFWQLAWESEHDQTRFFSEAVLSLPNISTNERDFDAVFDAIQLQVAGVKSRLLVGEW